MELKQKIIHESLKLFSLKGFLSTSLHDILKASKTSKGGFYNHFQSKEDLFFAVLRRAQMIWRMKCLKGLDQVDGPVAKVHTILRNYKDRYLKDTRDFPGGCVFVTLSVELDDQRPHLARELNSGFEGFKNMLKRLLDQGKAASELGKDVDTEALTEMIFAGMLGASVIYGTEKSGERLDQSIEALMHHLEILAPRDTPHGPGGSGT
jgi:AcrR family transcriptional regulator